MIILFYGFLFFLDWTFKALVETRLKDKTVSLFSNKVNLYCQKNYGVSFNVFENRKKLIFILNIIYFVYLIYFYVDNIYYRRDILLILTGGIGNFLDRLYRGYVVDYIYFNFPKFPVFNLSDIYIFIGVFNIIILEFKFF